MRADRRISGLRFTAIIAFFVGAVCGWPSVTHAQQASDNRDAAAIQHLADRFVDAVNHKSESELKAILHPKSRSCIRAKTALYFDGVFSSWMSLIIPSEYFVKSEPQNSEYFSHPEELAEYPVRPTHTLQITYDMVPSGSMTILLSIVKKGTDWYEVLSCPTVEEIKHMQAMELESKAYDQRVNQLIAGLAEPLRAELEALVRSGDRRIAVRKYQEASGENLAVAASVIGKLIPRK